MDRIQDKEVSAIWDRIKRYVDIEKLEGKTLEEVNEKLDELMRHSAGGGKDGRGNMDRLLEGGFIKRLNSIGSHQTELKQYVKEGKEPSERKVETKPRKEEKITFNLKGQTGLPTFLPITIIGNKAKIKVRGRTRTYSSENVQITYGNYKEKSAFYISNTRTKRRVSWGVIK